MSEIPSNNYYSYSITDSPNSINTVQNNGPPQNFEIEAHYSDNMKVNRPALTIADAPPMLPSNKIFSDKEATAKIQAINTDIYEHSKKEKSKHEFNRSLYFKIFGCVALTAVGAASIGAIRKFFKKS